MKLTGRSKETVFFRRIWRNVYEKERILSVFLIIGVVIGNIFWKPCYVKAIESGYDKITEINDDLLAAKLVAKNFVNTIATEKNGWEQVV